MHPYEDLPEHNFWRRAVADRLWTDVDFVPIVPFTLEPTDRIGTGGSCFAQHIARELAPLGLSYYVTEQAPSILTPQRKTDLQYGVFSARYGNIYTVRQLRQLLEFAFAEAPDIAPVSLDSDRWFDLLRPSIQAGGFDTLEELQADRASHLHCVRELFLGADCFVFTLGLTEAWYQATSGVVFPACPGTRAGTYDPVEHKFVKFRHHEVVRDLRWCVDFVKGLNSTMRWIFTVSPVALAATATQDNVVVATSASKAVLRAAVDDVCLGNDQCAYFPSYEICSSPASFGQFLDSDLRNISPRGVKLVMHVFGETFGGVPRSETRRAMPGAPQGDMTPDVSEAMKRAVQAACDEAFNDPGYG
jgi:hypothetical protein